AERKPVNRHFLSLGSGWDHSIRAQVGGILVRGPQTGTNNRRNDHKGTERRTVGITRNPKIPKPGNKTFPPDQGGRAPQKFLALAPMEFDQRPVKIPGGWLLKTFNPKQFL